MFALGCAVARAFPLYTQKNFLSRKRQSTITVEFCFKGENTSPPTESEISCLTAAADGIRLSAKIVDTPCNEMHTDAFLEVQHLLLNNFLMKLIFIAIPRVDKLLYNSAIL